MKESYADIIKQRRDVFVEIARMAYEDEDLRKLEHSVYRILPGEVGYNRDSIFKERATVGQRLRMGLGLNCHSASEMRSITDGIEEVDIDVMYYETPLVEVISFACEACPTNSYVVSDQCRKCYAHPCINVCPVGAVSMGATRTIIDQSKCIRCGRCHSTCPYSAIVHSDRPCASVCGVKAIGSDDLGRAKIDHNKCVSCGRCITQCPFGAIADKTQIYQLVKSIKNGDKVYAMLAPSFVAQFGANVKPMQIVEGLTQLGFKGVIEVALGADFTTLHESREFVEKVPHEIPFMATSCCASWSMMVEKMFPEQYESISHSPSPMIESAKYHKKLDPEARVVFIGPCVSKKVEAMRENVRGYVDFVITFEELMGMFVAKGIELEKLPISRAIEDDASTTGRGYGVAGGVAAAVKDAILRIDPNREVLIESAQTLQDCVTLMKLAKAGKKNGYLIEGLACPGGCVGGPGTITSFTKVRKEVGKFMKESKYESPFENEYVDKILREKEFEIEAE
ncbi:MAG: 4Fe-4S dicluster domain-containing protein [Bacillota bacterium]|nr:4Fe-4S dicluster domain-containing protein [Bacillota bacterium]